VVRVIDDVFGVIVLLRPLSAPETAPPLRMELDKTSWQACTGTETLSVAVRPADVLLLEEG
jgi:molybdate transport system ATP-binding protein